MPNLYVKQRLIVWGSDEMDDWVMLTRDEEESRIQKRLADNLARRAQSQRGIKSRLAEACNVSRATVTNWFKDGKISKCYLPVLARELDTTVDFLLTGIEPNTLEQDERQLLDWYRAITSPEVKAQIVGLAQALSVPEKTYSIDPSSGRRAVHEPLSSDPDQK